MGTSLTGLTPSTTYDALIKVGDNGPLSATLKTLSDGLGNDSALSLATTSARIGGTATILGGDGLYINSSAGDVSNIFTSPSTHGLFVDFPSTYFVAFRGPTEFMRITSAGNVGIGTSAPSGKLSVGGTQGSTIGSNVALLVANSGAAASVGNLIQIGLHYNPDGSTISTAIGSVITSTSGFTKSDIFFATRDVTTDTAPTERVRILSSGGITFNGDTAAANALDDYEEGTWTIGVSFGAGTTGITYDASTLVTYTKIGRQVTVNGFVALIIVRQRCDYNPSIL